MRTILLLLLLFFPCKLNAQIIVGYYYGNYEGYPHDFIEYNCLTHIAHAFIYPDSNGVLKYDDWFLYPELVSAAHENGKKIVVSVGGWGNSYGFKSVVNSYEKEMNFIDRLVHFIKRHDYDGADIDWEYPASDEKYKYHMFLSNLREAFDTAGIELLSVAIPAIDWNNVFDNHIADYLDWVGIMTYDFYGPWEKTTGHNTALYSTSKQMLSVDYSIKHYLSKGYPKEKLLAGMEYVGYKFNSEGLHKPHKGARSIAYNKSTGLIKEGWEYTWDDSAKVPYYFNPDSLQFITIDDALSMTQKSQYIVDNNLGGVIIWKLGLDYSGYNELLNITGDHLLTLDTSQPLLTYPPDKYKSDPAVKLEWLPVKGAGRYQVQISKTYDFTDILEDIYTPSAEYKPLHTIPYFNYWRVRAHNIYETGNWSAVRSFYIDISGIIYSARKNDLINFQYELDNDTFISLKLNDIYFSSEEIVAEGFDAERVNDLNIIFNERRSIIMRLVLDNKILSAIFFKNYWSDNHAPYYRYMEMYFKPDEY